MMFIISLFFSAALSLNVNNLQPHLFSQVLSGTKPQDAVDNMAAIKTLIDVGEDERAVALHNLSVATDIWQVAFNNWQVAFDAEQKALGEQKAAEDAEAAATLARDNAISLRDQRIAEKDHADSLVGPAEEFMNTEIARVDEEHETLNQVLDILKGLLPAAEIQVGRRSLLSRTTTLLSNPVFLKQLAQADPTAVGQVITLVNGLVEKGEEERNFAIGEYHHRVAEAEVARQNLVAASAALAARETELVDATQVRVEKTEIAQGKTAVEVEKRGVRDAKKDKLDDQTEFTNREIARIDAEKLILEGSLDLNEIFRQIMALLE